VYVRLYTYEFYTQREVYALAEVDLQLSQLYNLAHCAIHHDDTQAVLNIFRGID
jgi:hypothetical protein